MLISYDWLKDFVKNAGSAQDVAECLTMSIAEVEKIHHKDEGLDGVVVGEVLEFHKHPNADKLSVASINIGKNKPLQLIFGQMVTMGVGDRIPVAVAPTTLPTGAHIEKKEIRGVESQGMLCLDQELGLVKDGVSIQRFGKEVKPGMPVTIALHLSDAILEIDNKALTHRADLFSHWGLAREYAAAAGKSFSYPSFDHPLKTVKKGKMVKVSIANKADCARFLATVLEVTQGPTPTQMKTRLEAVGVRSLNRIVDITNYGMLETGHPFHAFDYDKLVKRANGNIPHIIVRRAKPGEKITTLDAKVRTLDPSILVVADSIGAVGIAGTMGGKDTEVDANTTRVLLEVARFDPIVIRLGAQKLGLRSEASMRFEKGLPRELAGFATKRGLELFTLHANAKIVDGPVDVYLEKLRPVTITLDPALVPRILGIPVSVSESRAILTRLGMKVAGTQIMKVSVPWFRPDLAIPEDLVEEIARIKGYPSIPEEPLVGRLEPVKELPELKTIREAGVTLAESGMTEVRHYSFYGPRERALLNNDALQHVETLNALSEDLQFMRLSLFPQILKTIKKNQRYKQNQMLFEFGHVFRENQELSHLALAVTSAQDVPFLKLKGIVEHLFATFGVDVMQSAGLPKNLPEDHMLDALNALNFTINHQPLGFMAVLHPDLAEKMGLDVQAVLACINVRAFSEKKQSASPYKPLPTYPAVSLDLAFTLPSDVPYASVAKVLKSQKYGILEKVELFDVYNGGNLPEGKKSLAFHLTFRNPEKTLSGDEAQQILNNIIQSLKEAFDITVRS